MSERPASPPEPTDVQTSLEALLERLVDYAGLFPPAALNMADTVASYARYVAGEDAWMLGRLIVPVRRLDEFQEQAGGRLPDETGQEPWHLSALTVPAGEEGLAADLERIAEFNRTHEQPAEGLARIDVIELRAGSPMDIESALDLVPDELFPFFELPIAEDPRGLIATLVGSDAGAKVRTGGVSADLYPAPTDLARFITGCAGAHVPFKATAGMHHPLGGPSESTGAREFGFLNVFLAAALAWHGAIDGASLSALLAESDPDSFSFDDDGVDWRSHHLTVDQVDQVRHRFAVSFGSCSFDDPREDLRHLGLL